jgi:hypothetical protein
MAFVAILDSEAVHVLATWDRTAARWAVVNRLGIVDHHLDRASTDVDDIATVTAGTSAR